MNISRIKVWGFENAILGLRYSHDSDKDMDSVINNSNDGSTDPALVENIIFGPKDITLMNTLVKGGSEHRKFLRAVHIQMSVKASMIWWKQFDTYKVATTTLSRSTMHTVTKRLLNHDEDFEFSVRNESTLNIISYINNKIVDYQQLKREPAINANANKLKEIFMEIIEIMPMSYMQERMLDFSYETALNIYHQRVNHKLKNDWGMFCETLENLPLMKMFISNLKK